MVVAVAVSVGPSTFEAACHSLQTCFVCLDTGSLIACAGCAKLLCRKRQCSTRYPSLREEAAAKAAGKEVVEPMTYCLSCDSVRVAKGMSWWGPCSLDPSCAGCVTPSFVNDAGDESGDFDAQRRENLAELVSNLRMKDLYMTTQKKLKGETWISKAGVVGLQASFLDAVGRCCATPGTTDSGLALLDAYLDANAERDPELLKAALLRLRERGECSGWHLLCGAVVVRPPGRPSSAVTYDERGIPFLRETDETGAGKQRFASAWTACQ